MQSKQGDFGAGTVRMEAAEQQDKVEYGFERAFAAVYSKVVIYYLRHGLSSEDARDLAQDTFERVYKNWGGFRGASSPETWIWRIAENILKNELRRREALKRQHEEVPLPENDEDGGPDQPPEALDQLLQGEREQLLRAAIAELPPRMRQCVLLRLQDQSLPEIAAALRVTVNTVKRQLFDAYPQLRTNLAPHFPELMVRLTPEGGEPDD